MPEASLTAPLAAGPAVLAATGPAKRPSLAPLRLLAPYLLRHPRTLAAALVALVIAAAATIALPLAVRRIVDHGFAGGDAGFVDRYFAMLLVIGVVLAAASAARFYCVNRLGERAVADLGQDVFAHLMQLETGFHEANRSGDLLSRLTGETARVRDAIVLAISQSLRNLILLTGALVMMFGTSSWLSLLVLAAVPVVALPLVLSSRFVRGLSRAAEQARGSQAALAAEALGQMRVVHAFGQEKATADAYVAAGGSALNQTLQRLQGRGLLTFLVIGLVFSSIILVLWHGASLVQAGTLSPGTLLQFVLFAALAAGALGELSEVWTTVQDAAGATERLASILDQQPAIQPPQQPTSLPSPIKGGITFDGLSFTYAGASRPALDALSASIQPGETVALVGASGSGKSTLFSLLLRLYDPSQGRVLLDGVDARQADPQAWRRAFALVPQQPELIGATIADAIAYGRPKASRADIKAAARAAQADVFIEGLAIGYDTPLGERGASLSGGQRQRLAIARALLRDAPVLLLDEATSALDAENERAIQATLAAQRGLRTLLIIAHRPATAEHADRVLLLDHGRLIAAGTHAELLRTTPLYVTLQSGSSGQ